MRNTNMFVESMETRVLFTALSVSGSSAADTIKVYVDYTNSNYVDVNLNGTITQYSAVRSISISGNAGNDNISISATGDTIDVPQTISGGDGDDTITTRTGVVSITGDDGNDLLEVGDGDYNAGYGGSISGGAGADSIWDYNISGAMNIYGGTNADVIHADQFIPGGPGFGYDSTSIINAYQNDSGNTRDYSVDHIYTDTTSQTTVHLSSADSDTTANTD